MELVTVRKLDHTGQEVTSYTGQVLHRDDEAIVLRTVWDRPSLDLGFAVLETGGRWTEFFCAAQWYNIFEICASDGRLQGWYCNITRPPRITDCEVIAEDLALDLWVALDGEMQVLDEEEFAALPLTFQEREAAQRALAELQSMVARRADPFDRIRHSSTRAIRDRGKDERTE